VGTADREIRDFLRLPAKTASSSEVPGAGAGVEQLGEVPNLELTRAGDDHDFMPAEMVQLG
jgi:hypothetical protein